MGTYIVLSKLTDEGRKTMIKKPDRIKEVNGELEAMGGKIVNQYSLLGDYDFITILEAEDHEAITKMVMEIGSRGTIDTKTMAALPVDSLVKTLSGI